MKCRRRNADRLTTPLIALGIALCCARAVPAQSTLLLPGSKDNSIYSNSASLSNGAGPVINVGTTMQGPSRRGLIRFSVAGAIPPGSTITRAELRMTVTRTQGAGTAIELRRLTASWGEGTSNTFTGAGAPATPGDATWAHRFFNTSNWSKSGADFVGPSSGLASVALGPITWTSAAMVVDVQRWLDTPSSNHGWIMMVQDPARSGASMLSSREGTTPPVLSVTFTPPAASVKSTGRGCGPFGPTGLTMAASGLPRLGNGSFAVTIGGGPPSGSALLYFAGELVPTPTSLPGGCNLYLRLSSVIQRIASGSSPLGPLKLSTGGSLTLPFPVPNRPSLAGATIHVQTLTPSTRAAAGFFLSNALSIRFGS